MNRRNKLHTLFSLVALLVLAYFAVWWFRPENIAHNFIGANHAFDFILFLLVTYVIWHPLVMEVLSWAISSHIRKPTPTPVPQPNLKVAFVTTFVPQSESIDLLKKTLPAMVAVNYQHDTWVLDEGNDPRVRELCAEIGAKHYSRHGYEYFNAPDGKYAKKTKGGNHNSWYDNYGNDYDIVAQMDTDFSPSKDYLTKTLGYFSDPEIAFVGTPQIYANTKESLIARGAAQQTYNFYGPILRGLSGMESTLLIGANHVIRVAALKDVDHYSAHITEDLLTGMKLHSKGWKSVYVPEALAFGEGPTTWDAYFSQQMRWAYGCMDVLLRHTPKLFKTMKSRRSIYYFIIQQHYFSGLAMVMGLVGITTYALFGVNTANIDFHKFVWLYLTVIATTGLMSLWLQGFNIRPSEERGFHLPGKIVSLASWPIFFLAFLGVMRGKKLTYKVTPKGVDEEARRLTFRVFRIHLLIAAYCVVLVGTGMATHHRAAIMIGWMAVSALTMAILPFAEVIEFFAKLSRSLSKKYFSEFADRYALFDFSSKDSGPLPAAVNDDEKYSYLNRRHTAYMFLSLTSIIATVVGMVFFVTSGMNTIWPLMLFFFLTLDNLVISYLFSIKTKDFDFKKHGALLEAWQPKVLPSVDILLPIAGESIVVLENTWRGVLEIQKHYKGQVKVYCLDDGDSSVAHNLANKNEK